jgi:RNA 3'-terminal phosphate cyclase (ATP)
VGWYPRGGGEVEAAVTPTSRDALRGFVAGSRPDAPIRGLSAVSHLPRSIAERQRRRAADRRGRRCRRGDRDRGRRPGLRPGTLSSPCAAARIPALGRRGLPAEEVADAAVEPLLAYLASGRRGRAPRRPARALLRARERESAFTCPALTTHLATVAWVVEQFLPVRIRLEGVRPARVRIGPATPPAHPSR